MQFSSIVTFALLCAAATASSLNAGAHEVTKRDVLCTAPSCLLDCQNAGATSGQCSGALNLECVCTVNRPLTDLKKDSASAGAPAPAPAPAAGP